MSIEQAVSREILSALAGNPSGMRRRELFPLCDSAGEPIEVSNALRELIKVGLIEVVVERNGNQGPAYARTTLIMESAEQEMTELLHADKQESAVIADPELAEANGPQCDLSQPYKDWADDGTGDDVVDHHQADNFDLIMKSLVAIKAQAKPPRVIDDLDLKLQCLNRLQSLLNRLQSLLNPDVAEILSAIAVDLEATY